MSEVRMRAVPRTDFGKGAARRVRRSAQVPAVIYGHGEDPRHVSLPGHDLMLALKSDSNVLLDISWDGGRALALPKQVVRDPLKGFLEHIDLLVVRRGERVQVDVPVSLAGEASPDALVDQQMTTLSVEAEATHIPGGLEVSVEGLGVGSSITASDVELPEGVTLLADPDAVVVQALASPTAEQIDAELADAEAELGAGASGLADQAAAGAVDDNAGQGDVVPDTDSQAGGPGQSPSAGTDAGPSSGG